VKGDLSERKQSPAAPEVERRRAVVEAAFGAGGVLARSLPGYRERPSQREMALAVFDTIAERSTLAAEAGTGTGKTLAYLVPAILAGGKVLISAGTKALQDQIFDKDLPSVCRALGVRVDTAVLKGRANYVCKLRLERTEQSGTLASREDVRALGQIVRFARETQTGDRAELREVADNAAIWPTVTSTRDNCLGAQCEYFDGCFVMRARRRALEADVVVVNHHLLLADMALREDTATELLPAADVVVIDEAHHLTRIAPEFFGDGWSLQQIVELGSDTLRIGLQGARDGAAWPDLVRALETAGRGVRLRLGEGGAQRGTRFAFDEFATGPVRESIANLDADLARLLQALEENQGRDAELDALAPRVQRLRRSLQAWHVPARSASPVAAVIEEDLSVVRWVSVSAHGAQFHETPLQCADSFARAREQRSQAWILTSATLTAGRSFAPFLDEIGLTGTRALRWDSPFDFPRQALLYLPERMPNPRSEDFPEQVAESAWPVVRASRGRAFLLCSTLRGVQRVAQRLRELMADDGLELPLLVQGDASRRAMLADFRRAHGAILVGSVGFWEGIDVRGDALSVVVIDKLPFAPPDDPVVAARIRQMTAQGRNAFQEYQLPHALTLLRQGVGRLIRDDSDRGVLMILDERLLSKGYGKTMLANLPPFTRTRSESDACAFVAQTVPDDA
jgi:ATP-dependent DNA helicase DinG